MFSPRLRIHLIADLPPADALTIDLRRIDAARRYTNFGPLSLEFEAGVRQHLMANDLAPQPRPLFLTSLASCYHALEIGLRLLGAAPGKTVLMPAITFPACPLAAQHTGAEVLLADIDPDSWTLTPQIARRIATRTKVDIVMPVALYGVPLPAQEWDSFSRDTGIAVIFDAAAAIGAQPIPQTIPVAHSLHATKPFGIGEGGLLVARDESFTEHARRASNFGTVERICCEDGINAKLSEYHAAVGLAQLRRWDAIITRRKHLREAYQKTLQPLAAQLAFQPGIQEAVASCLMLRLNRPIAEHIIHNALSQGLALHRTYLPPLYHHPHFAALPVADGEGRISPSTATLATKQAVMTQSEKMAQHILGVPFHPFLEAEDIEMVAQWLTQELERFPDRLIA